MSGDKYLSTQRELREFVHNYFDFRTEVNFPEDLTYHAGTLSIKQLYFIIQHRMAHAGISSSFPCFGTNENGELDSIATCAELADLSDQTGGTALRLSRADSPGRSVTQVQSVQMPNPQDRVPSPNYMVRGQATTSANLKTEGACRSYHPFSSGKMLVQQNDVANMSGSATQGIAATCGNLPTQERAPTLHPILQHPRGRTTSVYL